MDSHELTRQLQKLQMLIQRTNRASSQDFELHSHWGRYLCVLVAGFLENTIAEIYIDYAKSAASEPVASYAASRLTRIQNPNAQRFLDTARSFKRTWVDDLEQFLNDAGRKEAIDSIMANRHQIAHGRDSGITIARVDNYLKKCVEVIEFIESQCKGTSTAMP